jgi:hypothetical protein
LCPNGERVTPNSRNGSPLPIREGGPLPHIRFNEDHIIRRGTRSHALLSVLAAALAGACTSATSSPTSLFTVYGSAGAPPLIRPSGFTWQHLTGDPGALRIGVYALYISPNADCSSPVLVQDFGTKPVVKDFVHPVLFSGSPADGAYQCVAIKMSDVIRVQPTTTFSVCDSTVEYAGDIYRAGETDWKDVDLNPIIGTGSDSVPTDDRVTIILTRDTTAAQTRGFSTHQTLPLSSDLIVPSQSTFYWNGQGTVTDAGGHCGVDPGHPSFQ